MNDIAQYLFGNVAVMVHVGNMSPLLIMSSELDFILSLHKKITGNHVDSHALI